MNLRIESGKIDSSNHVVRFLTPKRKDEYIQKKNNIQSKGPIVPRQLNFVTLIKSSIEHRKSPEKYRNVAKDIRI